VLASLILSVGTLPETGWRCSVRRWQEGTRSRGSFCGPARPLRQAPFTRHPWATAAAPAHHVGILVHPLGLRRRLMSPFRSPRAARPGNRVPRGAPVGLSGLSPGSAAALRGVPGAHPLTPCRRPLLRSRPRPRVGTCARSAGFSFALCIRPGAAHFAPCGSRIALQTELPRTLPPRVAPGRPPASPAPCQS
jgi:hypothetical protein